MRYHYLPQSEIAHLRTIAQPVAPAPAYRILVAGAYAGQDAPRSALALEREISALPEARVLITQSVAEEIATAMIIQTCVLRFRALGLVGFASWWDTKPQGVVVRGAGTMTMETLRVRLGIIPFPETATCERCGSPSLRRNQNGSLRAHKTLDGQKCEAIS